MKAEIAQKTTDKLITPEREASMVHNVNSVIEWTGWLVDENKLPELQPPLTHQFRTRKVVNNYGFISHMNPHGPAEFGFSDMQLEVNTNTGNVALIGVLGDTRFHIEPETLLPLSIGHKRTDFPDTRSLSVAEPMLHEGITGDTIHNIALSLLPGTPKEIEWAPRTAYRTSAQKTNGQDLQETEAKTQSEFKDQVTPFNELSPDEKRDHIFDAVGAVSSLIPEPYITGYNYTEVIDALSMLAAKQGGEYIVIDPERLEEGAERASEITWEYVEAALEEAQNASDMFPHAKTLWEEKGLTRSFWHGIEIPTSFLAEVKEKCLAQRKRLLADQATKKLPI